MSELDWKYYQDKDFMTRLGSTLTPMPYVLKIMILSITQVVTEQFGTSKIIKIYKN